MYFSPQSIAFFLYWESIKHYWKKPKTQCVSKLCRDLFTFFHDVHLENVKYLSFYPPSSQHSEQDGNSQVSSTGLESAGGASPVVSRLATLPSSISVVNRRGMLWGNCLGVKPNTRQTVYSPLCIFPSQNMTADPFLVKTDTFHHQVFNRSVNYVAQRTSTSQHQSWCLPLSHSFLQYVCMYVMPGCNYTKYCTYIKACSLFEGELWATDGYLINKFPPDRSVFMLHVSHSTSVLQSLMCFSQLFCFPLMWPKMTCGLSGKMVSAQHDELPFYFKLSIGSMANRGTKHQTSGYISLPFSYLGWVCVP